MDKFLLITIESNFTGATFHVYNRKLMIPYKGTLTNFILERMNPSDSVIYSTEITEEEFQLLSKNYKYQEPRV